MTRYIDAHKAQYGVEPICRVLQFAPATYYAATSRPPSARRVRDEELKPEALRVWQENRRVYGADKVWTQLRREGVRVARCTVERLMRELGIAGVVRGKVVRTTFGDETVARPAGLGRPAVPGARTEPALGGRPDLRQDLLRLGLRCIRD